MKFQLKPQSIDAVHIILLIALIVLIYYCRDFLNLPNLLGSEKFGGFGGYRGGNPADTPLSIFNQWGGKENMAPNPRKLEGGFVNVFDDPIVPGITSTTSEAIYRQIWDGQSPWVEPK